MRAYLAVSGTLFGIVALMHVLRLVQDWPVQFAGWTVPLWVSWIGVLVAGGLCLWGFRLAGRRVI